MESIIIFHQKLEAAAADSKQEPRDCRAIKIGQHSRQGDCYVHPIKKRPASWDIETTDQTRQVAVGQGEGSNHCASGKVRVFWPKNAQEAAKECPIKLFPNEEAARRVCLGPVIEADEEWTLTHPKHAHHEYPAGLYLVTYQLDRRTMRQVRD
jgi:hypothetical protein